MIGQSWEKSQNDKYLGMEGAVLIFLDTDGSYNFNVYRMVRHIMYSSNLFSSDFPYAPFKKNDRHATMFFLKFKCSHHSVVRDSDYFFILYSRSFFIKALSEFSK
jgi:hypothetical protein